jgi:DNA-directed RNA polymerase specialized sigma24 family protein
MQLEVWDAVRRLPRRQREVIALRYLGDLRERDIAATVGFPISTMTDIGPALWVDAGGLSRIPFER